MFTLEAVTCLFSLEIYTKLQYKKYANMMMNVYQSLGILKSGNTDENDFTYAEISVKILSMCLVVLNSYDVSEM